MKKINKSLNISAFVLLLAGFMFTSSGIAFADEKVEETKKEVAADTDKKADADGDKKKKDGEEPECD